jgi:hypothetical protein
MVEIKKHVDATKRHNKHPDMIWNPGYITPEETSYTLFMNFYGEPLLHGLFDGGDPHSRKYILESNARQILLQFHSNEESET